MFRVNHRLVSGQASVFVPFLFTEGSSASLQRTFLSKDKINASLRKLRQIDYSVFYREMLFHKDDSPITKEYMMEEVAPDVILLPACGTKRDYVAGTERPQKKFQRSFFDASFL